MQLEEKILEAMDFICKYTYVLRKYIEWGEKRCCKHNGLGWGWLRLWWWPPAFEWRMKKNCFWNWAYGCGGCAENMADQKCEMHSREQSSDGKEDGEKECCMWRTTTQTRLWMMAGKAKRCEAFVEMNCQGREQFAAWGCTLTAKRMQTNMHWMRPRGRNGWPMRWRGRGQGCPHFTNGWTKGDEKDN